MQEATAAPPSTPPLRLKFKPIGHEPIEAEFTAWFSGAAVRCFDAQGRLLVHVPLAVPAISKNGNFELPGVVANFAAASGTASTVRLVDRQGASLGIEGPVSDQAGAPLRFKQGTIVELAWAAVQPAASRVPVWHIAEVEAFQDGGLAAAYNTAGRLVAQWPLDGKIARDVSAWAFEVPARVARAGELEIELHAGNALATLSSVGPAPAGARPPYRIELPLLSLGRTAPDEAGSFLVVREVDGKGDPTRLDVFYDAAKAKQRKRRESVEALRRQATELMARLSRLEGGT